MDDELAVLLGFVIGDEMEGEEEDDDRAVLDCKGLGLGRLVEEQDEAEEEEDGGRGWKKDLSVFCTGGSLGVSLSFLAGGFLREGLTTEEVRGRAEMGSSLVSSPSNPSSGQGEPFVPFTALCPLSAGRRVLWFEQR